MADTIPLMQMARQILQEYKYNPKDGEGLALLSSNALSMSEAALALHKYDKLFKMAEIGIALAILAENGKYLNYLLLTKSGTFLQALFLNFALFFR